jgi:integrase
VPPFNTFKTFRPSTTGLLSIQIDSDYIKSCQNIPEYVISSVTNLVTIDEQISQANKRLKTAKIRASIERRGDKLWLRATLPPKPHATKTEWHQQKVSTGLNATPAGLQSAVIKAKQMGVELDSGKFNWGNWIETATAPDTIGAWLERFEADHWGKTKKTQQSLTTWKTGYHAAFSKLDRDRNLTLDALIETALKTEPDSRTRKRVCTYLHKLAAFANLEGREKLKELMGNYSSAAVNPRLLPSDKIIAEFRNSIKSEAWRWLVGVVACYGLRSHEAFRLDLRDFPVARVTEGKTGSRFIYPLYPEWAEEWGLNEIKLPDLNLEYSNGKLSTKVAGWFYDRKSPFKALDLRHCYARRCFEFGLAPDWASGLMGHSLQVHLSTYRAWIDEATYRKAYEAVINRSDRPQPPA